MPVLGILSPGRQPTPEVLAKNPFVDRLRELGWIDGKTISIERVFAGDNPERLPELAATLVAKKVDVIWTNRPQASVAAARATSTIPIVFWLAGFAVELGLVDSLARPGRNATGVAYVADEGVFLKRLQLLRELAPHARRYATFYIATNMPTVAGGMVDIETLVGDKVTAALSGLGFERRKFDVPTDADLEPALAAIAKWAPDAMVVPDTRLTFSAMKRIVAFARRHRLIDVYDSLPWAQAGGLFSYGIVWLPTLLRTADMVDRILRGAKPADMPVELPDHYELSVNLTSAKGLGLTVPQSILRRADRLIE
jgi:putative ABC transport system substrate-binding protein